MRATRALIAALFLGVLLFGVLPAVAETGDAGARILAEYSAMHAALAADSAQGVSAHAATIAEIASDVAGEHAEAYRALAASARRLDGSSLEALRAEFKEFSKAMATFVNDAVVDGAQLYYCPMAKGYWIQSAGDEGVRNPYYGKSMLKCGTKVDKVEG
jgi:hypothetical protein